MQMIK